MTVKDSILRSKKSETLNSEWASVLTGFLKVWQEEENDLSASLTWHILTNSPHQRDTERPENTLIAYWRSAGGLQINYSAQLDTRAAPNDLRQTTGSLKLPFL